MAYTGHGHHIPGTTMGEFKPREVARCGGPKICPRCKSEVQSSMAYMVGESTNYQEKAKDLVRRYVIMETLPYESSPKWDVYVVWFTKTLQNWKALLGTTMDDGMYYEVTYDGEKKQTYLDAYTKVDNRVIPD